MIVRVCGYKEASTSVGGKGGLLSRLSLCNVRQYCTAAKLYDCEIINSGIL